MSDNEQIKTGEENAGGSEWSDQEWPPFKAENGEGDSKDADYYREHPEEIGDFVSGLIQLRGGEEKIKEGATWDKELKAHVDSNGVPRDWMHLTGYLKKNPDQIDRFVEEYKNLEYFKKHPEDLSKFVAELVRLRGGEDAIKEGTWDSEQVTHVDEDGAPRDWMHLTGYLKKNPDKLGRFVNEYMDLKVIEDGNNPDDRMESAAMDGDPNDEFAERLRNDPEELARICEITNHGLDPEELQYYKDNPDKIPQLIEKYNKMMAEEEPVAAEGGEENDKSNDDGETPADKEEPIEEKPKDEDGTQDEESPQKNDDSEDKNGAPEDENKGVEDTLDDSEESNDENTEAEKNDGKPENYNSDYYPRLKGESDEIYEKRLLWEQQVREKSEQFPRFRALDKSQGYPEGVNHADYDAYLKKHPDGSMETDEEWLARVGIPPLAEFLSTDWSKMSDYQKKELIKKNPRLPGEKTSEWARRIGISGESLTDNSEKEKSREEIMAALANREAQKWIADKYGLNLEGIDALSDDDLRKLYDEYMKSTSKAEGGKEKEKSREEIMAALANREAQKWLSKKGLTLEGLEGLSDDELRKLYEEFKNRKESNENDEDKERKRLLDLMKGREFQKWLADSRKENLEWLESLSAKELQDLYDEYLNRNKKVEQDVDDPLVMARIDRERDARAAAHDIAEHILSEKLQNGRGLRGLAQRVLIGGLFREGAIIRYEHRAYDMIRARQRGEKVEGLSDADWSAKSGLERFVTAYVEGYEDEMIHSNAGEKIESYRVEKDENGREVVVHYYTNERGERVSQSLESGPMFDATMRMREAVSVYAQGGSRREFEQAMADIQQELRGRGEDSDKLMADNYIAVAEAARARYEHGKGIDDVMAGFAFINGEARSNVRTEAHRDALDKITNRIANSAIGRLVPPEVAGTAASLAVKFGKGRVRSALILGGSAIVGATMAPAVVPVAVGALTASVFAGIKERNRVTGDRSTQARRLAQSETAGSRRYDERMEATQYDQYEAEKVTNALNEALESGDANQIRDALAIADTTVEMSDRRKIDLLRYKSGDTEVIERQRMDMDVARARARAELRRQGVAPAELANAVREATDMLERDISAKDRAFRQLRRRRVASMATRSAVTAGVMSVASQEIVSLFRPDQVGVLESLGVQLRENNADATNTFIAGALGLQGAQRIPGEITQNVPLTQEEITELQGKGYSVTRGEPRIHESTREVSVSEYMEANEDAHCAGYLGNGTKGSDGNELHGYYKSGGDDKGPWTRITGRSWGSGQSIEAKDVTVDNSMFVATIGGKRIFIPAVAGEKPGQFFPDYDKLDPTIADIIRNRQFSRIQFGYLPGTETDGKADYYSFWSFSGNGKASGTITSTVREVTDTWNVAAPDTVGSITRDVDSFATFGVVTRQNLTLGRRARVDRPNSTGGAPGTHRRFVDNNPGENPPSSGGNNESGDGVPPSGGDNGGGGDDGSGRGAVTPESTPTASNDSPENGNNSTETQTQVNETPSNNSETRTDQTQAPAQERASNSQENNATQTPEQAPTGAPEATNTNAAQSEFKEPVKANSGNLAVNVASDPDSIRAAVSNVSGEKDLSDSEVNKIRYALNRWNRMTPERRDTLMSTEYGATGFMLTKDPKEIERGLGDIQALITLHDSGLVVCTHIDELRFNRSAWREALEAAKHPRVPFKETIRHDSQNLDIPSMPYISEIQEVGKNKGITTVSESDMLEISRAIDRWNKIDPKFRRNMMDGKDLVEERGYFAHGDDAKSIFLNEQARDTLAKFGIIEVLPTEPKREDNHDDAMANELTPDARERQSANEAAQEAANDLAWGL